MLCAAILGFSIGKYYSFAPEAPLQSKLTEDKVPTSALFRSQTATFQGEITEVNENKILVKSDSGQIGEFPVSDKVLIYKFKEGSAQASASSDLKTVETDKPVSIILELISGEYKVVSITYLPSLPSPKTTR